MIKPTIKIPYNEFMTDALCNFSKNLLGHDLVLSSIQYQKKHSSGDYAICELPDYIEIELEPTEKRDICAICNCLIGDNNFGQKNGHILCGSCYALHK